jgi:hypothetical protein
MAANRIQGTNLKFDTEFHFLLNLNPAFEGWRALAAEWYAQQKQDRIKATALSAFFVRYLHGLSIDKCPEHLFDTGIRHSDLWVVLELNTQKKAGKVYHDIISDFLEWVLHTKLAQPDADGHLMVPANLRNPFQRFRTRKTGKESDTAFLYVLALDPRMTHWQNLAAEWMESQKSSVSTRRAAIDKFLVQYIFGRDLPRHPMEFLTRATTKPDFGEVLIVSKSKGNIGSLAGADIQICNFVADFIDWVLLEKLSIEDDYGGRIVPHELHNPVARMTTSGIAAPTETTKSSLSIRYIKELRAMLSEGPNFRDWVWAQQSMENGKRGGDWFVVDPAIINRGDPDCVWRERDTTAGERKTYQRPARVTELWSPVRAVALFLKLELPLRTFQVRMLDSGEADTWRYLHGTQGGSFAPNDSPLATGNPARPCQRGVFHRSVNEAGAGLYINTNKTADVNKAENAKGYVIPWAHETVLYWLSKLRDWQDRYNPIDAPTAWCDLTSNHFGRTPPHREVLEQRGAACFLFRDAAANGIERGMPLTDNALKRPWYLLLARLEQRCLERGETLDDYTPIQFVDHDSDTGTHYPLHALRVSLISYLVLDLQLPIAVVSKLIAGHSRIVMTLYYTKFGHAYMKEVLGAAERGMLEADQANHRRFLMDATMEQAVGRFASISVDAVRAAIGNKSSIVFEDKGICPVGGTMCDVGGECIKNRSNEQIYAPVPGYPRERNCVRCRFFLSGPAFLPGLIAHFNTVSYEAHETSERHNDLQEEVTLMENRRNDCARDNRPFTEIQEMENLSQRYEAEAEAMGKLVNDMQATNYLIARSMEILKQSEQDGVKLVAVGDMSDIEVAFAETPSELYQIEVLCENAVIYPEIDARKATLRRSQILDLMLQFNNMQPVFYRLSPKLQFAAGNAVMQLIQARTGSLKGALDYVEGLRRLRDLGIADETWDVIAEKVAGTPARDIIEAARTKRTLPPRRED